MTISDAPEDQTLPLEQKQKKEQQDALREKAATESAKFVMDLWSTHVTNTMRFRQKLNEWYKQYRGFPVRKNYDGLANVVVNETLQAVEAIVAQMFGAIYSQPRRFYAKPKGASGEDKAKLAEDLVINSLDEMDDKQKVKRSLYQLVKYGTAFAKVPRKFESKVMTFRKAFQDHITGLKSYQYVTEPKINYDDADLEYIDLLDIAIDPGKAGIEFMKWIVVHKRVTYDDLKARERKMAVANIDKLAKPVKGQNATSYTDSNFLKVSRMQPVGINYQQIEDGDYDLYECWAEVPRWWVDETVDIHSDEAAELIEAVIEVVSNGGDKGGVTIRLEPNPYWHQEKPFVMGHYIQVDDESYGIGVCEISECLQQELNDKRNQSLDYVSFNIFPMLERLRGANIDKSQIKKLPHSIVDSDIANGIRPVQLGGALQPQMMMDGVVKEDIRNNTGATNAVQGVDVKGNQTAYEVNTLERRGASKISMYTTDFGQKFLKPMYTFIYKLHQQYTTTDQAIRKIGQEGVKWQTYGPDDLVNDYTFCPILPSDADSVVIIRNQMIQFIGQLASLYPQMNIYRLARKIYMSFGYDDVDQVIPEPQSEKGIHDETIQQKIQVLAQGENIVVNWYDNHTADMSALQQYMLSNQANMSPMVIKAFQDAINQHLVYLHNLQAAAMQQQQAAQASGQPQPAKPQNPVKPQFNSNPTSGVSQIQRQTMSPTVG